MASEVWLAQVHENGVATTEGSRDLGGGSALIRSAVRNETLLTSLYCRVPAALLATDLSEATFCPSVLTFV